MQPEVSLFIRIFDPETDVVENGIAEKKDILRHITYLASQRVKIVMRYRNIIDQYLSASDIVKPGYQIRDRALSGPVVPIIASDSPGLMVNEISLIALIPVSG